MAEKTIPIQIRVIFDNEHYRCELRKSGVFFKATSGDFLDRDVGVRRRVSKLMEIMSGELMHVVALGTKNINDYSVNSSFQPVDDIYAQNIAVHPE